MNLNSLVYICQKCAIDRRLRPPTFAPLSVREGPYSVLKCLSMAHFSKILPPGGNVYLRHFRISPELPFPHRGIFSHKSAP